MNTPEEEQVILSAARTLAGRHSARFNLRLNTASNQTYQQIDDESTIYQRLVDKWSSRNYY